MGSKSSKPGKFVLYFNREVSQGQRGNVIQQVPFHTNLFSTDATIEYIVPTMEQLRSGIWIGTYPLPDTRRLGIVGLCYHHGFVDQNPQMSHTALLINGLVAQIENKWQTPTLQFLVRALKSDHLEDFKWHLILRKAQGNIDMESLLEEFKDYTYGYFSNVADKQVNQESFCGEIVKKIFKTNSEQTTSLLQEAVQQSYNWRKRKQL